jgi:flavodoxin
MKTLILYYSSSSHTSEVANLIHDVIGGDIEAVLVKDPYFDQLMERSRREIETGSYPEIKPLAHNPEAYDVIVLGTPTWWVAPASPIYTLMASGALNGKKVYPFITTGWDVDGVAEKIKEALPDSDVKDALIVKYENAFRATDDDEIKAWAEKIER